MTGCIPNTLLLKRLHSALLSCVLAIGVTSIASGATIYRETFGRPAVGSPGTTSTNILGNVFDWPMYRTVNTNTNLQIQTAADNGAMGGVSSSTANGKATDVANINASTNEDGTTGAYARGIYFMSNTTTLNAITDNGAPKFAWTPEFSFNPANYNNLTLSWYQGDSGTTSQLQPAVRIGGQWYVSATGFANTVASASITNFNANAQLMSLAYNPAAANWVTLAFDGTYDVTTHTGTDSTVPFALGSAPSSDLSGTITAFGLLAPNAGTEIRRFDTFQIDGDLVPEPASMTLAIFAFTGLGGMLRQRKSLRAG